MDCFSPLGCLQVHITHLAVGEAPHQTFKDADCTVNPRILHCIH